jgi:hypothetical protein
MKNKNSLLLPGYRKPRPGEECISSNTKEQERTPPAVFVTGRHIDTLSKSSPFYSIFLLQSPSFH